MFKKLIFLMVVCAVSVSSAQEEGTARLRVMQLSFVPQVSAVVDVKIDETVVFQNISFPFATDYVELAPGDHTLTTTIVENNDATASTSLTLESGHSYSAVVEGDYSADEVRFIVIDESDLPLEETGSAAAVVNLTPEAMDIYFDEDVVLEGISPGGSGFTSLPTTEFTASVTLAGEAIYNSEFVPLSNATLLGVTRLSTSGDLQVILQRSSDLTIREYLQSIDDGTYFAPIAEMIGTTDLLDSLADEAAFTLFLPTDGAIESLGDSVPSQLDEFLSDHIVEANLPPYELPDSESLTMLSGNTVSVNYGETESGYWEIEAVPILWDMRLANGVIYAIDGVIDAP